MIIPVTAQVAANKIAHVLNLEEGGEHTFEGCRLSANAQEPASHVAASGQVCEDTLPLLYDAGALHAMLVPLAAQRERECPTLAECVEAVNAVQIATDADPFAVFAAAGLQVVEVPV